MAARPAARMAFGSCSKADSYPVQPVWAEISRRRPTHLLLLGDPMYMDFGGSLYHPAARGLHAKSVIAGRKAVWLSGDIHENAFVSHALTGAAWPLHDVASWQAR